MENNYLSVAQVNTYIKQIFESEYMLQNICVYGEVSSYNVSGGIAYFNIKDSDNMLSCVLFGAARFDAPKLGDLVLVTGSISFYAKGGRLSFNANSIAPYGRGMLYEKFLELKNKLEKLGYFDDKFKKQLPKRVKTIGVVTSETGAVIKDIIDVSTRRNDSINIVLYPSKVQGVGAEYEIVKGIKYLQTREDVDVIIVARGGGSLEDLQPFNTEVVAIATFECVKPIVSAVGHETDFTIIDFVSDLRAPTPSAAAEIVVYDKKDDFKFIENTLSKIIKNVAMSFKQIEHQVKIYNDKNFSKLKLIQTNSEHKLKNILISVNNTMDLLMKNTQHKLDMSVDKIENISPQKVLKRGFVKLEKRENNKVVSVSNVEDIQVGDDVLVNFYNGVADAKITNLTNRVGE